MRWRVQPEFIAQRSGAGGGAVVEEPLIGLRHAGAEIALSLPAELFQAADIEQAAWIAVRLGGVPADFAGVAGDATDDFRRLTNADLLPRADVDDVAAAVVFEQEGAGGSKVINEEELTCGSAAAPEGDARRVMQLGLVKTADE